MYGVMNAAAAAVPCPQCGTALTADAPDGLCPRCLLGLNFGGPPHDLAGDAADASSPQGRAPEPAAPEAIARRFPHLEILECLGRGGMGVVYKARQPRLNRLVALKVLAPGREQEPRFAERFAREARALARLAHPAIVAIHDFGESDGLFYLVMEYVDGANLRSLIRDRKAPPADALSLVPILCDALQFAHDQGVVHRDIKPENILIDSQGRLKIADFGIAKILGPAGPAEPLTEARRIIGTPHYMAPEQVEHPSSVDHRADIYSLGVVFYELLTGELPLGKFSPPSRKAALDPRLDAVVLRSLEKEPGQRFQRAVDLKAALDSVRTSLSDAPPEGVSNHADASQARTSPAVSPPPPHPPGPAADVAASVRQVRIAAAGLILGASANLLVGALILAGAVGLVALDRRGVDLDGALPPLVQWLQGPDPSGVKSAVFLGAALMLIGSLLTLLGARSMRRLASYRFALFATTLGMVVPPGNLFGLPWGLWALSVLGRRNTQSAFHARWTAPGGSPWKSGPAAVRVAVAVAIPCLLLLGIRFWMESGPSADRGRNEILRAQLALQADRAKEALIRAQSTASSAAAAAAAPIVPPVAIETIPTAGASNVDPGLTEIRVTFSKPMKDGQWSWANWLPETFPEITGTPRYLADGKTCVLPVRLQPGRVYGVWLNTGQFQNFTDSDGLPAVPYLLTFQTRDENPR